MIFSQNDLHDLWGCLRPLNLIAFKVKLFTLSSSQCLDSRQQIVWQKYIAKIQLSNCNLQCRYIFRFQDKPNSNFPKMASNDLEGHRGQLFWGSNGTLYFSRTFETFDYKSTVIEVILFTQNWLVHPVCQICTPILGSSYCLKNTQMSRLNAWILFGFWWIYAELLFKGQTGMKKVNHH